MNHHMKGVLNATAFRKIKEALSLCNGNLHQLKIMMKYHSASMDMRYNFFDETKELMQRGFKDDTFGTDTSRLALHENLYDKMNNIDALTEALDNMSISDSFVDESKDPEQQFQLTKYSRSIMNNSYSFNIIEHETPYSGLDQGSVKFPTSFFFQQKKLQHKRHTLLKNATLFYAAQSISCENLEDIKCLKYFEENQLLRLQLSIKEAVIRKFNFGPSFLTDLDEWIFQSSSCAMRQYDDETLLQMTNKTFFSRRKRKLQLLLQRKMISKDIYKKLMDALKNEVKMT